MIPAIITPIPIQIEAQLLLIPKRKLTTQPVHAPVAGSGIATNKMSPIAPYFSIKLLFLLVRINNHEKKRSASFDFLLKNFDTVSSMSNIGITGSMFPITESVYALYTGKLNLPIANGIAPLNSETGKAETNKTVSSLIIIFPTVFSDKWNKDTSAYNSCTDI